MSEILSLIAKGLRPLKPSLAPSSTIAKWGLSASAQFNRDLPPALVSPETPPFKTFTLKPDATSSFSRRAGKD